MNKSKRNLSRAMGVFGAGAVVWKKPIIEATILPAHANTSCIICNGSLATGDPVIMGIGDQIGDPPQNTTGTVLGVRISNGDVLVEWDGWNDGHDGVCDIIEYCPPCSNSGNSRFRHPCNEVSLNRN